MSKAYRSTTLIMIAGMCLLVGCKRDQTIPANPPTPSALSLDEWKKLPIPEKYDESAFERLRLADPKLKSERAWQAYMKKEIMPERNKDIPIVQPSTRAHCQ